MQKKNRLKNWTENRNSTLSFGINFSEEKFTRMLKEIGIFYNLLNFIINILVT